MIRRMSAIIITLLGIVALSDKASAFEMTPAVQAELDEQKTVVASWASDPVIVKAVKEQNGKGPIPGMDNPKWKSTRRSDPVVQALQESAAGRLLKAKVDGSNGMFSESFLSAAQGEKVASSKKRQVTFIKDKQNSTFRSAVRNRGRETPSSTNLPKLTRSRSRFRCSPMASRLARSWPG